MESLLTPGGRRDVANFTVGGDEDIPVMPSTLKDVNNVEFKMSLFMVCGNLFEVQAKYTPIKPIGKGAYGVVCSARNVENYEKVAIKKITNAFENAIDAKRTLREIKLLRHLHHENVIRIVDVTAPANVQNFNDVYVMYELMDTDLHQIIRSNQPLSDDHCQYFVYQLLRGLKYIHSANVLHRDLKPSNLLLNANCDLKICDFGLARTNKDDLKPSNLLLNANCDLKICDFGLARTNKEQEYMTEYVVTRWYRAPELLLSCSEYTSAIDVWSVGCIFAELLGRKPLFPGKDYVHQLNLITRTIGLPEETDMAFISSEKARRYIRSLPKSPRVNFHKVYPDAESAAIDLIDQMLVFDPQRRITVEQALAHPYLASLHDVNDEPAATSSFEFDFEGETLSESGVRDLVFKELGEFHADIRAAETAALAEAAALA
eukprot:CAMPEP_0197617476 /NCGR_PEP_ID=MMETSP1326-20131121/61054_1 /TAXON_ID=1155430 /ORGANISM="Genus nov. species nov., Strain RCC2288" /LENGTH=431 /DNA_ID=CAMNT_0043186369 /DNA_START=205 /DNA_END=1497 /DNA_ORIENTATION=+